MKFKVLGAESPVTMNGSNLLFGIVKGLPYMSKNEGLILLGNGDAPERKLNQKWTLGNLYPIGECNLAKIEELKKETNSKNDNELLNKIAKETTGIIDFTKRFK